MRGIKKFILGDLVDILSGFPFDASFFGEDGDIAVIRIRDVLKGHSSTRYSGPYDDKYLIRQGDILIGMDGEFNRSRWSSEPAVLNQRVCKISARSKELDENYLFHFLPKALKAIEDDTPFVTVKHLSTKSIIAISIPLPPLPEQRRIAQILDKAEALRAKRRTALAKLGTLAQSIFLEMFGDPAKNPMQFPRVELSTLVKLNDNINYGVVQPGDDFDEGIPLIRVGDIVDGAIRVDSIKRISPDIEKQYRRSRLIGDEILVSCVGSIGFVALADSSVAGYNIARAVARIPPSEFIDRQYLAAYLRTEHVQKYFVGELRTVSQPTLNIKQLSETLVVLPPLPLQQAFAHRVEVIELLKATHRSSLAKMDALFTSLQYKAFEGEL